MGRRLVGGIARDQIYKKPFIESGRNMVIDSIIGGYCTQLVKRVKYIEFPASEIISKTEKATFSKLINQSTGMEKDELVVYYRLAILVESILMQYRH